MAEITALLFGRAPGPKLEGCRRSVESVADSIIVIHSASDSPISYQWNDSIADLYNFGIDHISAGWILLVNEDEKLTEGSHRRIRKAVDSGAALAFRLTRETKGATGVRRAEAIRLWDSGIHARFSGCVFPELDIEESMALDVKLSHEPSETEEQRRTEDLRLVNRELELRPGSIRYEAIRAQLLQLTGSGEADMVRKSVVDRLLAERMLRLPPALASWIMVEELQSVAPENYKAHRTDQVVRAGWRLAGRSPNVLWAIANLEQRRGDLFYAMHAWNEIEKLIETRTFEPACPPDPIVQGPALFRNLAQAALMVERLDIAESSAKRALALDPNDAATRLLISRL